MVRQLSRIARILLFSLIAFNVLSCAPELSLTVIIPEEYSGTQSKKANVYLLQADEYSRVLNIKTKNQHYYRSKLMSISDSLNTLKKDYKSLESELAAVSSTCSTLIKTLPIEYCRKIDLTPTKLLKYDDLWQLSVALNNRGDEDVWGLVMSVWYKDIPIINHQEYSVYLQPGQTYLFNNITFDLSNNLPLQYSIVSYPGGMQALFNEALRVDIDTVVSKFTNSIGDCKQKNERLRNQLEVLGIGIDLYSEETLEYLNEAIIEPVNRILVENLRQVEYQQRATAADTLTFNDLKKEEYQLFIYSDPEVDSTQYIIPVNMKLDLDYTINPADYRSNPLFMNKHQFLDKISILTRE